MSNIRIQPADNIDREREAGTMKKLYRSENNRMLCGVCGGIAEYFGIDATMVRLGFAAFSLACGSGILAYIAAAVIMPHRTAGDTETVLQGEFTKVE